MEVFQLKSLTEFYQWKEKIERETCSSYVQQRGQIRRPNGDCLLYFDCNRSGEYTPHGKGLRRIKTNSSKIGSKCASNIRIKVTDSGHRVIIRYSKHHDKHPPQVEHLRLPRTVRASIAEQLKYGVPIPQIITAIRYVSSNSNVNHRILIKRKDLLNIKRDFKIKNEVVKHKCDKTNLKLWAKDLLTRGYVNPIVPFCKEADIKNTAEGIVLKTDVTKSSSSTLPTCKFVEPNLSPVAKAETFIQLYQQNRCIVGQENSNKIHELLNKLITICTQINSSSISCTDKSKIEQLSKEKTDQQENTMMMCKRDILIMHNYYKPLSSEEIGMDITEELFELEEVFEESKFYDDMGNGDIVDFDNNMLDEVLNIHTEFDHNYL